MAKKGWVKDRGKWYYYDTNGSMKKGWIKDKEKWYYLLDNGEMVANRWLQDPNGIFLEAMVKCLFRIGHRIVQGSGIILEVMERWLYLR